MKRVLFALLMFGSVGRADILSVKPVSEYGDVTVTSSAAVIFFRPNGSTATPVTYTASTVVKTVYLERVILSGVSDTAAMTITLWDTATTHTAGSSDKAVHTFVFSANAKTDHNVPRVVDFTNSGLNAGIYIKNFLGLKVDSGTNTPIVKAIYRRAPKNITIP